nr:S8 family serine peptidase [Oceanobacillus profundus]
MFQLLESKLRAHFNQQYAALSGTSMASPHVQDLLAFCFLQTLI